MPFDPKAAAKEIARDSIIKRDTNGEPDDTIGEYARSTVQLRIPMETSGRLKCHLEMLRKEIDGCLNTEFKRDRSETSTLLAVSGRLRMLNQKVNAYRKIRPL